MKHIGYIKNKSRIKDSGGDWENTTTIIGRVFEKKNSFKFEPIDMYRKLCIFDKSEESKTLERLIAKLKNNGIIPNCYYEAL